MSFFYPVKLFSEIINISFLDYGIFALLIFLFFKSIKFSNAKFTLKTLNHNLLFLPFLILVFLYSFSLFRNFQMASLKVYIVFLGSMLIFYTVILELLSSNNIEKNINKLFINIWASMTVIFLFNIVSIFLGTGRVIWGKTVTLIGLYFYKTDYAIFLTQYLIIILFMLNIPLNQRLFLNSKIKDNHLLIIVCVDVVLIFLTNARIYLMILLVFIIGIIAKKKMISVSKLLKLKNFWILIIIIVTSISILSIVPRLFPNLNFIGIDLNNGGIFSESNTQGRSVIWEQLVDYLLHKTTLSQKIFGTDLISSGNVGTTGHRAHNDFLQIWFSIGIVGVLIYIYIYIRILKTAIDCKNMNLSYVLFFAFVQVLISGLTQETIINTQQLWFLYMILGIVVSYNYKMRR